MSWFWRLIKRWWLLRKQSELEKVKTLVYAAMHMHKVTRSGMWVSASDTNNYYMFLCMRIWLIEQEIQELKESLDK
jgi:hypothetical protein